MREHEVKILPEYYAAARAGLLPFSLRKNDRAYRVGDALVEKEWNPAAGAFTGRSRRSVITHILDGRAFLRRNYVALTLKEPDDE
jgi:hypothetical protein